MAKKRELNHYIKGSGERQEGSATLIKEKEQRGRGIEDEGHKKGSSAGTHGQRWEAWKTTGSCSEGKRCIVPMINAEKHGILQRDVV